MTILIIAVVSIVLAGALWLFSKSKINYLVTESRERLKTEKDEYLSV